jgi:carbon storage regulator CsrA
MLVLSRKVGEQLVIGGNIRVVVHRISGNRVTIGIEAPDDVRIVRGELELHEAELSRLEAEEAAAEYAGRFAHDDTAVATLPRRRVR